MDKETFWKPLEERFPGGMKIFHNWIDGYKKEINWDQLFNDSLAPKYHDLPDEIQIGIFLKFMNDIDIVKAWSVDIIKGDLHQMVIMFIEVLDERTKM